MTEIELMSDSNTYGRKTVLMLRDNVIHPRHHVMHVEASGVGGRNRVRNRGASSNGSIRIIRRGS